MKFAKALEEDRVPEWASKYINYKQGKKRVKAVGKAIDKATATPKIAGNRTPAKPAPQSFNDSPYILPHTNSLLSRRTGRDDGLEPITVISNRNAAALEDISSADSDATPNDLKKKGRTSTETTPIMISRSKRGDDSDGEQPIQYGSIVATPPSNAPNKPERWELPDPAIASPDSLSSPRPSTRLPLKIGNSSTTSNNAYEVGTTLSPNKRTFSGFSATFSPRRSSTMSIQSRSDQLNGPRPLMKRLFSSATPLPRSSPLDVNMGGYEKVRTAQNEFFQWMDGELDKIDTFYRSKEDEATKRLEVLREQLHTMRNRRIEEIADARRIQDAFREDESKALNALGVKVRNGNTKEQEAARNSWVVAVERAIESAKLKTREIGPNSKALEHMVKSPTMLGRDQKRPESANGPTRDYARRPSSNVVKYRDAKQKLKLALKEFYRALELLKSYALLNRTGFRKINKKYDKMTNSRPPLKYFSEKVNKAHFNQSDLLENHLHAVEDMYARYFERGNYKVAIGKLRTPAEKPGEYVFPAFRSGLSLGIGAVFAIQGLVWAFEIESAFPNDPISTQTSYLLQIYGGYFLALYLFAFFCLDCGYWARHKINYPFIFEFDPRHHLDWRQLAEFPCFLFLVFGFFMWINFSGYGAPEMFLYYPVILIGYTTLMIFLPAPTLFHKSRKWFTYSHWRLFCAGLYPVEFRDFFLGDMYCSLTYFMGNIELFFCLYATYWGNPSQCNSSHSRLLGFFSALPAVWRAAQCLRRYADTRSAFPHLVNCGKYCATIMYYTSLSLFRIDQRNELLATFIVFATVNAIYASVWDLLMDWSLFQPSKKHPLLRDTLGYKKPWLYYTAMVLDPILRFNWIFYIIYTRDLQHSSTASFLIAFSEVNRRGMWTLFRVENEHCSNVMSFKASRDIKLPYDLEGSAGSNPLRGEIAQAHESGASTAVDSQPSTANSIGPKPSQTTESTEQRRSGWARFGHPKRALTRVLADAHRQDFEKKRKPEPSSGGGSGDKSFGKDHAGGAKDIDGDSSDEEEVGSSEEEDDYGAIQEVRDLDGNNGSFRWRDEGPGASRT